MKPIEIELLNIQKSPDLNYSKDKYIVLHTKEIKELMEEVCYSMGCSQKHLINQPLYLESEQYEYLKRIVKQYNDENFKNRFETILKDE